jgi:prepilin-type N-terminal cleavage/methylation domain-containing protein/prepilin-type processing-associated H-X9-DG protein
MNRKGFTLIELLVVIAIIAILAAILFPVFARARSKAMQTSCLANVKQIDLALNMYTSDYDAHYPGPLSWTGWYYGTDPNPYYLLTPYIKNNQLWVCPSATPAEIANVVGNPAAWGVYVWNDMDFNANPQNAGDWWGASTGIVSQASTCIALGDGNSLCLPVMGYELAGGGPLDGTASDPGLTANPPYWPNSSDAQWGNWIHGHWVARHDGMANFGFLDGHAKAMSLNAVANNRGLYLYPVTGWPA